MKKKFILAPVIGLLLYLSLSSHYYGPAYGGLGDRTGASGALGCSGLGCHASSATASTTVTMQLLSGATPVTAYVPGNTYTLKIHGVNTGGTTLPNFGFQMAVVKLSGAGTTAAVSTGTFGTAPSSTHTYTIPSTSVTVFEHYNATYGDGSFPATTGSGGSGSTYDMTIAWTAPSAGTGNVVLYGVINAVNHDSTAGPTDLWNTATAVTICESPAAITGTMTVCAGATTTLSDVTTGGTWSSGSTGVATVGSTGVVTGVSGGTAVISYTTSCTSVTAIVTVNAVSPGNFIAAGGPTATECSGLSTLVLSNINPGGSWSSASGGVATVVGGTVTAVSSGTAVISYTLPSTGCAATTTVTVNATPTISGTLNVCTTLTTTLTATPTGGTWSTSSGLITVNSTSGAVTGVTAGNPVITYTSTSGCTKTATMTVNTMPGAITGTTFAVCQGSTISLGDPTPGGVWSSGSTGVATVGTSGNVTGVVTGSTTAATAVISYTGTGSCAVTKTITVNPQPAAISPGSPTVCQSATTTLTDATSGGTWSSVSTGIATIGSTGVVTGVAGGTSLISYTLGTGCTATTTITVNPTPPTITGTFTLCPGADDTLHDAGTGVWSSGSTGVAIIDPTTGIVTGVAGPGTSVITFFDGTTLCPTTVTVTVNASSSPITGTLTVCQGLTTPLSNASGSGTWTSSAPGIATVTSPGSSTTVTGILPGTALVTYVPASGCGATATVTVNPLPGPIAGVASACVGGTTTLSDPSFPGGTWSSGSTGVATVGSSSGIVTAISPGTAVITHTMPTGCTATITVTVNPLPVVSPVTGTLTVCIGTTTTLSDATSSGVWSSSNTAVATIGTGTGIVTGVSNGISIIAYTVTSSAGCSASSTATVTVNPLPSVISGTPSVCVGSTRILSVSTTGGTWSSTSTGIATVTPTGLSTTVTGVSAGTTNIIYTLTATGCNKSISFTVNPLPVMGAITGTTSICQGSTSALADTTAGGTWSTASSVIAPIGSSSGIVTGSSLGTTTISYTVTNGFGCTARATTGVTVNAVPGAISGPSSVCTGSTIGLIDATGGGAWTSGAPSIATVGSTGTVTGVSAGTAVITYTLPTGCTATKTITVNLTPAAISGTPNVCVGLTRTLTDGTTGGTWTSSNTLQATVGSGSGIVTGVLSGTPTITYTSGGCFVTMPITVNPLSAISGLSSLCSGATTTLTDATAGGTWTSGTTSVATIGSSSGLVTAGGTGTTTITYTLSTGCAATMTFTVISAPSPITGSNHVCVGSSTPLTDGGGGTWTSSAPGIASVGSTGIVTGVTVGTTAVITYSLGTGCNATLPVTVNPLPSAIGGSVFTVCPGATITLTDGTTGGSWSSSNTNASVGSSSGIVTGVTTGTSVISYTSTFGCVATKTVTINASPAAISGPTTVCVSSTATLTDGTGGGTWSSTFPGTASVGSASGIVSGITSGTTTISYTVTTTGCATSTLVTVNPLPATITGTTNVCVGSTTTLADGTIGGSWTATPGTIATVGSSSGIVTGVGAGTATVTYTSALGCGRTTPVTVNPLPTAFVMTGGGHYCAGGSGVHIGAAGSQTGVSYQLLRGGTPVGSAVTGTGISLDFGVFTTAGTYTIAAINTTTGCTANMTGSVTITIDPLPGAITGIATMCQGATTTLSDTTAGGTWSSGSTGIATVGTTGIVSGVSAGTAIITYTAAVTGCTATDVVTVNPLPAAIGGTLHVCMSSTTTLTDALGGGSWSSTSTGIATIGSGSGVVTPVAVGTDVITYAMPTGCLATATITVNPLPVAGTITGVSAVCVYAAITLADTSAGGTWSSSNTSLATVGSTGSVTGVSPGTDTIFYSVTNICGTIAAMHLVTVNPLPYAGVITGTTPVCMTTTTTFTDPAPGGTWSSSNTGIATVGTGTGVVTPVAPGADTILYRVTNGCGTKDTFQVITVASQPFAGTIVGIDSVCQGDTITLSNATTGGSWSVSNTNASVNSAGMVIGITAGTDTVKYAVTNSCGTATATLLVKIRSLADCNVGVRTLALNDPAFRVYPNPSSGSFTVELPQTQNNVTITITDMLGRTMETRVVDGVNAQKTVFTLSNVAAGSYFVNAYAGDQTYRAKLIIW